MNVLIVLVLQEALFSDLQVLAALLMSERLCHEAWRGEISRTDPTQ